MSESGLKANEWTVDLAGVWTVVLDRENAGEREGWYARRLEGEALRLPGNLPENGIGDPVTVETPWTGSIFDKSWFTEPEYAVYRQPGNVKVPFCLQPESYYAGIAWYQREIEISERKAGERLELFLERPHWATRVWLDGEEIGSCDSLCTPHVFTLPDDVAAGPHRLSIRVDNSRLLVDIGENSHTITDHTQGNWNGITGRMELRAKAADRVLRLDPYPDLSRGRVRVEGQVLGPVKSLRLAVEEAGSGRRCVEREVPVDADQRFSAELSLGEAVRPWDEESPFLYRLVAEADSGATLSKVFGFRELSTRGRQLLINGRPFFVRATLECAIFPETGYPPCDVEPWRRIIRIARSHGLNTLRFHSWCPPEAAFVAGDEAGFFFQVESGSWPNWSTTLGDGKPVDDWLEAETARILAEFGHHPCFVFMVSGNEPEGPAHADWLAAWVTRWRERDPRRLYSTAAAWPIREESDFHVDTIPRIQAWGAGLESGINAQPPETVFDFRDEIIKHEAPLVSHEIGQWCAYPDFREMERYTGYLKPRNFEIFRERLEANGQGELAEAFVQASGRLQTLCYKADIEAALRTPEMAGFQLLDLHDFPGQGSAIVGVLNAFWESKGYISADGYKRFCGPVVPLARLAKRIFEAGEVLRAEIEVAHWASRPASLVIAEWSLRGEASGLIAEGRFPARELEVGGPIPLGELEVPLGEVRQAQKLVLEVSIPDLDAANSWDLWAYPKQVEDAGDSDLVLTDNPARALEALRKGGRVLLAVGRGQLRGDRRGPVQLGFSSIFWNTAWTEGQAPHTLGILCDPEHPALRAFPTESHSNWQWWYPIHEGGAMILDGLPVELSPIVRVIDDWYTARRLGMLLEAQVEKGELLLCSVDLMGAQDPVNRQLRTSLMEYLGSPDFRPELRLTAEQLASLVELDLERE